MNQSGTGPMAPAGARGCPVLKAPAHWRTLDFISDLHLQADQPATFAAFCNFLQTTTADAVFILGDLFEAWVGDDILDAATPGDQVETAADTNASFETRCSQALWAASRRIEIFFVHGNRDFLIGPAFARTCGLTLLHDPCVLDFGEQRWLLSHGDALCLADTEYLQFRAQVRSSPWQLDFLQQPLPQRLAMARQLRSQSKSHQQANLQYADVDGAAACDWLRQTQASTLIHGHTHRPGAHDLDAGLRRLVLSDWDLQAQPPRAEVLRLCRPESTSGSSVTVERLAWSIKD